MGTARMFLVFLVCAAMRPFCFGGRPFWAALCVCLHLPLVAWPWGFFAHQQINRYAVTTLPPGMFAFYKKQTAFLSERATHPDRRRYVVAHEAEKHFIDLEAYPELHVENQTFQQAVAKYGRKTISERGALPWAVVWTQNALTEAFRAKDVVRILKLSADLGHYVADAHVPLHATENYDGQLSGQTGIHALWETQLPLLFFDTYDLFVGPADCLEDPLAHVWSIVRESHALAKEVLQTEAQLSQQHPALFQYGFDAKGTKKHTLEYATAYHNALKGQVERRLRESILEVGRFWVTAWVRAGAPNLVELLDQTPSAVETEEPIPAAPRLPNVRSCGT